MVRMWRKVLTGAESARKFNGMNKAMMETCRHGCKCKETIWHAVAVCVKLDLGQARRDLLQKYKKHMEQGQGQVWRVVAELERRVAVTAGGVLINCDAQDEAAEMMVFGFVPVWLAQAIAQAIAPSKTTPSRRNSPPPLS